MQISNVETREVDGSNFPSKEEVAQLARVAVMTAMSPVPGSTTGSDKSGPGEWFWKDVDGDPFYHHGRAARHVLSAMLLQAGTEIDPKGETAEAHLERAITRSAFALAILRSKSAENPVSPLTARS